METQSVSQYKEATEEISNQIKTLKQTFSIAKSLLKNGSQIMELKRVASETIVQQCGLHGWHYFFYT